MLFRLDLNKFDKRKWNEVEIDFQPKEDKFVLRYRKITKKRGIIKESNPQELSWKKEHEKN